jgi:hypothetical protein
MVIAMAAALALVLAFAMVLAVALAVIAVAGATATAGAAHLLRHGISHLFISGGSPLIDSNAEVLIDRGKQFIKLLTSFEETLADGVFHHILTQAIKGGNLFFGGGHALHVLVAQLLAVLIHLAEKVGSSRVLVEKADAGAGRNDLLAGSKCVCQVGGELHKLRGKRCICHNAAYSTTAPPGMQYLWQWLTQLQPILMTCNSYHHPILARSRSA